MACNCNLPTCSSCTPCCPPNPCAPCGVNECPPSPPIPCPDECEIPLYTHEQCTYQTTDCVNYTGEDNECIGISKDDTLTSVINDLSVYIKETLSRLTAVDEGITILPVDDDCDDKATIQVNISDDEDNQIELRPDGYYVPKPETVEPDPITTGELCTLLNEAMEESVNPHKNEVDQDTYSFLLTGCEKISAPTGFAVTGSDRVSAFGAMEWYDTLTLANAAAVATETVLIYNDTSEDLLPKTGVNYQGVGIKQIKNLTVDGTTPYQGFISNLDIQGNVFIDSNLVANRSIIRTNNVTVRGNFTIEGYSDWYYGYFPDNTKTFLQKQFSRVFRIESVRETILQDNSEIAYSNIDDAGDVIFTNAVLTLNPGTKAHHNTICTIFNKAVYGISTSWGCVLSSNYIYSTMGVGLHWHIGTQSVDSYSILNGNTIETIEGTGCLMVGTGLESDPNVVRNMAVMGNNTVRSYSGIALDVWSCSVSGFTASSRTNHGARIAGSDSKYINNTLENCHITSYENVALRATRDIKIVGCTIKTLWDDPNGHAALFGQLNIHRPSEHYYLRDNNFITYNPSAYMVKGLTQIPGYPLEIRMVANNFTCQNGTTSPNTIDFANIDPLPILVDSYGNYVY